MNEFYITLMGDNSFDTFPDNTLASFQTQLPQPVNLGSDIWSVGLAEISYPKGMASIISTFDRNESTPFALVYLDETTYARFNLQHS